MQEGFWSEDEVLVQTHDKNYTRWGPGMVTMFPDFLHCYLVL